MKKTTVAILTTLACMAFASQSFAAEHGGLYRDANGELHYTMCKAGKEQPVTAAMNFVPIDGKDVLGYTDEEYSIFCSNEGGEPNRHIRNTGVVDVGFAMEADGGDNDAQ